jgi:hypothetical protein
VRSRHRRSNGRRSGAFRAVLYRDLYVTWRELPAFLAQVILQLLFLLFVFGKVLGTLTLTRPGYANLLFPGLLALTAVITAMQTLAFPLVAEFGWTKEIEDRLLAPMPTSYVVRERGAARRARTRRSAHTPVDLPRRAPLRGRRPARRRRARLLPPRDRLSGGNFFAPAGVILVLCE